ncbi:PhzF family phenazine biosynthesis protein [Lichenibacterium dinghuense]|uniref:PhzF family phenazine biosynthesis protein n=1 Tax=Lichenibacterium dinghuense TaxID=2895977 RepID=UPI001F421C34|nr:PhzF family phenazine biosynthesis protein [Lichenibacterium sp. 6Y81]
MRLRFHTLDVFTDAPLSGNPLAVVHGADGLDAALMQAVAREFNLAETVFLLEPRDPVNTARLRIFTPERELPFAGHPTVGTAVLLAELRAPEIVARGELGLVLEEAIGPVHCTARRAHGRPRASFVLPRLPEGAGEPLPDALLAAALGIDPAAIGSGLHRPALLSAGVPFTTVPLASAEAVDRLEPRPAHWPAELRVYAYAPDGPGRYRARMFAWRSGVYEDPATGSAAAAFAGAVMRFDAPPDGSHALEIRQGAAMGRPSLIGLGLEVEGGALASASIGGGAVILCDGTISL